MMSSEDKKVLLLLHLIIFNYHGLDEKERLFLNDLSLKHDAKDELNGRTKSLGTITIHLMKPFMLGLIK